MSSSFSVENYIGINIANRLEGVARELFLSNLDYMHLAFGDNVEYERLFHQILLCNETKDYLYSAPKPTSYERGSRPILEKIVDSVCEGAKTETDKALSLMRYIRDLKDKVDGRDYFYGGTEEELIKKGERYCERVSRLMCGLCDIAGIPARIIFHVSGGHLTTEVFVDGAWGYIDPRFGLFYINEDGRLLSVVEIADNPEVIFNQPKWVYDEGSNEYTPEFMAKENHDVYLRKNELQLYGDYRLSDASRYHYEWMPSGAFPVPERDNAHKRYVKYINEYRAMQGVKLL